VSPILRALAKVVVKGCISGYHEAARLYDSTARGIGDLAREAIAELGDDGWKKASEVGTDLAKEAVEELGTGVAKEATEEAGADLAEEAVQEAATDLVKEAL
jgi:hypothetical protein